MDIEIQLTRERIGDAPPVPPDPAAAGARVEFRGVVRGSEDGQAIAALEYEAYPEMALRQMRHILEALGLAHPCLTARVVHRLGVVPAGEAAISVAVGAAHRAEAFALLAAFMDRLKQDVPIWKVRAVPRTDSRNANRPRSAGAANSTSWSTEDGVGLIAAHCRPLEPERASLHGVLHRVLREPVCTPEAQSPFDRAAADSCAVRLDDPGPRFRVVDEIHAGDWNPAPGCPELLHTSSHETP